MDIETCENCGQQIGQLETPCIWQGKIVCVNCRDTLNRGSTSNAATVGFPSSGKATIVVAIAVSILAILAIASAVYFISSSREKQKLQLYIDDRKSLQHTVLALLETRAIRSDPFGRRIAELKCDKFVTLEDIDNREMEKMIHAGFPVDEIIAAMNGRTIKNGEETYGPGFHEALGK